MSKVMMHSLICIYLGVWDCSTPCF